MTHKIRIYSKLKQKDKKGTSQHRTEGQVFEITQEDIEQYILSEYLIDNHMIDENREYSAEIIETIH